MAIANLVVDNLRLQITESPEVLSIAWLGKADQRQPRTVLAPWFDELSAHAKQQNQRLEFRFEKLEHFNSATILALVRFVQDLRRHQIRLLVVYDDKLQWQKMTFDALRPFERPDGTFELQAAP